MEIAEERPPPPPRIVSPAPARDPPDLARRVAELEVERTRDAAQITRTAGELTKLRDDFQQYRISNLPPRKRTIAQLIFSGLSQREVARRVGTSEAYISKVSRQLHAQGVL